MSLDVAALAAKYEGEVVAGGVVATVEGRKQWVAQLTESGVLLTPLGVRLEQESLEESETAPAPQPKAEKQAKSKKGISKPAGEGIDALAAALDE